MSGRKTRRGFALLIAALIGFAALPASAQTPAAGTAEDWVGKLAGLETPPDLDVVALRQQAADRIKAKSKADAAPIKRPPVAPQLLNLPQIDVEIQFDEDAAVVRPESYPRSRASRMRCASDAARIQIPDRRPYRIDGPA